MELKDLRELSAHFDGEGEASPVLLSSPEGRRLLGAMEELRISMEGTYRPTDRPDIAQFAVARVQRPRTALMRARGFIMRIYCRLTRAPESLGTLEGFMLQGLTVRQGDNLVRGPQDV